MTEPRVILYGIKGTPYTEKVLRVLALKEVSFEFVEPSKPEDLRRWSPQTGQLPVIELEGERTVDSTAILDLLDARWPEPPLLAANPKTAREQRRLEGWVSETFGFYMMRWVSQKLGGREMGPKRDEQGHALGPLARMGLLDDEGRIAREAMDTRDGGPGPEFERRIADLEGMLGDRDWFYGDRISRADISVFAAVYGMYADRFPGGRDLLARYPALLRHAERVDAATGHDRGRVLNS